MATTMCGYDDKDWGGRSPSPDGRQLRSGNGRLCSLDHQQFARFWVASLSTLAHEFWIGVDAKAAVQID
jgi:hypothetical protein